MQSIYWVGYCDKERNQAINEINKIINQHGFTADFKMFSDVSLSMIIEIEERRVDALYKDLAKYMQLNDSRPLNSGSAQERTVLLHITFTKGTGDLRIEVPAVPG
ncbi:hypothetical protein [Pontibacter vulgaris]|uniref:hypothetical protein n=1 Tax=Pontibacter vulgaris TaxID=2905679 RepID=UPI001FA780B2|nr:hypothetical protein [Pontibacter vulgaris]